MYLKLDEQFVQYGVHDSFTIIEIANCIGNQTVKFLKDPSDETSTVSTLSMFDKNGRHFA